MEQTFFLNLGLSKGTENGTSSFTISWLDHDGIVKGTDYQKLNTRFSSDYGFLNNKLKAGGNVAVNWWKAHYMPGGAEENAVKQHPAKAVYDVEGVYVDQINDVLGDAPNMMRLIENEIGEFLVMHICKLNLSRTSLLRQTLV